MTTLENTLTIDRSSPGWLRRAWEEGLARERFPGPAHCGEERGYLLRGAVAETLEPFIGTKPAPGMDEGDTRILDFFGLDTAAAAALLADLPARSLELDWSMYPPSAATMLRVIADNPGMIIGEGTAYSPELPAEAIRLRALNIYDTSLLDVEPDVVPAPLPAWIDDLPRERYEDYLQTRQWCLEHGRVRPAWVRAVLTYDIPDARRFPHMSLLRDEAGVEIGVRFQW